MPRPLAVVTGASSGIGASIALALARRGFDLLLVARREQELNGVAARARAAWPGVVARALVLDVTSAGAAARLVDEAPDACLVVNNAGFGLFGQAVDVDAARYRDMIALNISALSDISLAFGRHMARSDDEAGHGQGPADSQAHRGTILNIASMAAFVAIPYQCVYAATKAYVVSFSEALHYELRGRGVHVLCHCPGPTLTEANESGVGGDLAKGRRLFFHTADEVAEDACRAALDQRETSIPGVLNRLAATLFVLLGRRWSRAIMGRVYRGPAALVAGRPTHSSRRPPVP